MSCLEHLNFSVLPPPPDIAFVRHGIDIWRRTAATTGMEYDLSLADELRWAVAKLVRHQALDLAFEGSSPSRPALARERCPGSGVSHGGERI